MGRQDVRQKKGGEMTQGKKKMERQDERQKNGDTRHKMETQDARQK